MENFVNQYSKSLNSSFEHLTYETISTYINFYYNLSDKEKEFIEKHLNNCTDCYKKFIETFDEDFELGNKTISLDFQQIKVDENKKYYQSDDGNIEIMFEKKDSKVYLKFLRLPVDMANQNFRIAAGEVILRILSAQENKIYFFNQEIVFEDIIKIDGNALKVYDRKETASEFKLKKHFVFTAAASIIIVVFVIGYFYFAHVEKKVITINKNKTSVDSLLSEKDKIVNQGKIKRKKENLIAENIVNQQNFKPNPVLENFVDRNIRSEFEIEINFPGIGDTLTNRVKLSWKSNEGNNYYNIVIVNNENNKVWESGTKQNSIIISKNLSPGLFYWKIETSGKLVRVGKFYIK